MIQTMTLKAKAAGLGVAGISAVGVILGTAGTAGAAPSTYTVHSGDTLSSIAHKFSTSVTSLEQANHLANANQLSVGQVLQLSGVAPSTSAQSSSEGHSSAAHSQSTQSTQSTHTHTSTSTSAPSASSSSSSSFSGSGKQACIISHESRGNANVTNSSGHYGLYQFSASTWAANGGSPSSFGHASVAQQNQVYNTAVSHSGYSPWAGDGC